MAGEPAVESDRLTVRSAGLETRNARRRVTSPRSRYSTRSDAPTHQGLPRCHPLEWRVSALPASGRSSASGAAVRQPVQRPVSRCVRNDTEPLPCQCRPTRSKRRGVMAPERTRSPRTGTSSVPTHAATRSREARRRERQVRRVMTSRQQLKRGCTGLRRQDAASLLDGILTSPRVAGERHHVGTVIGQ
jgi:hypothetical protein